MIRQATVNDARQIAQIHVLSWKATYAGQISDDYIATLSVVDREQSWRESLEKNSDSVLVSVDGEDIQGFISFGPSRDISGSSERIGEVYAIYLSPDYLRRTLGKQLWRSASELLGLKKFKEITVWVLDTNISARRFYENMGCFLDGGEKREQIGDQDVREVRYRSSLK